MLISASEEYIDELIAERNAIRNQRDELLAHVERLQDEIDDLRGVESSEPFVILMRDICEQEPFDPDNERAVCVDYDWLYKRIQEAFAQSLAAVRDEALRAARKHLVTNLDSKDTADMYDQCLMDYAQQLRTGGNNE